MGPALNELSAEALDHIEQARARAHRRAERRELLTELVVSVVFVLAAVALSMLWPDGRAGWGTAVLLVAIYQVLLRVRFEIGEGTTTPVQLAFIPMLVLLPPGADPAGGARGADAADADQGAPAPGPAAAARAADRRLGVLRPAGARDGARRPKR